MLVVNTESTEGEAKGNRMNRTTALTGELPFVVLIAAALALPVSFFLLWVYRRAVLRSMRVRSGSAAAEPVEAIATPASSLGFSFLDASGPLPVVPQMAALLRQAERAPWQAAMIYACAGACYAALMSLGWIIATRDNFGIVKFLFLFWSYLWPLVLTVNLVAGSTRHRRTYAVAAYFAVLGALGVVALLLSSKLTTGQLVLYTLVTNGPPTILLLTFLARRIRAVGPLVLTFCVIAATGSALGLDVVSRDQRLMRLVVRAGSRLRLSGITDFYLLIIVGFVIFGLLGWIALQLVRRRYERKQISDQSLTIDSIWLLFAVIQSIGVVFEGWWWIFSGPVAFVVYKLAARIGFRVASRSRAADSRPPKLLLLRVFSLGKRSERLFDALGKHWLRVGSVRLIAGPDLATSTVEPHEFLDFLSGKLARRFIDGPQTLDLRLAEMDTHPDWDGRFRVTDFFCHDDTWRMAVGRLIGESDAILMDLRGFSRGNSGCRFEIAELLNVAPLARLVFVVDGTTDVPLLEQVTRDNWSRLRSSSPNRDRRTAQVGLFRLTGSRSDELQRLLHQLCVAAASETAGGVSAGSPKSPVPEAALPN